jgi:hypothetical protein
MIRLQCWHTFDEHQPCRARRNSLPLGKTNTITENVDLAAGTFSRATPERGGPLPSIDVADALLDERRER